MKSGRLILTLIFGTSVSFILGVLTLFIVNVPLEAFLKQSGATQAGTNTLMTIVILLWAVSTLALAVLFYRRLALGGTGLNLYMVVTGIASLLAIGLLVLLTVSPAGGWLFETETASSGNGRFVFGSYPDKEKLAELKADGYVGVVSLLSPTIPFENILLKQEKKAVEEAGLRFYSVPMLPWITGNEDSIKKLKQLVTGTEGKLFIHCYLGKHRIDLAKKVIEGSLKDIALEEALIFPDRLERGILYTYKNGKEILGPYPTDEEWFSTVLRSRVAEVVSFLDPENPDDRVLIEKEKKILDGMGIKQTVMTVKDAPGVWPGLTELLDYVRTVKKRIYIHGFKDDARFVLIDGSLRFGGDAPQLDAKQRGRLYGINREDFPERIGGAKAFYVTGRIMVGQKPTGREFEKLAALGIATVIFVDEPMGGRSTDEDFVKEACTKNGMAFVEIDFDEDYISDIAGEAVKDANPCFVLTSRGAQFQVDHDLKSAILR